MRTAFVRNWSAPLEGNLSLEHWRFVFFEFSQTRLALQNTFVLGVSAATAGTLLVTLVGYLSLRKLVWGHRYLAFLATAPVAIPGIVLAVGLFLSYTHPPLVLYGTLSIIFLAYVTKELPVGYQQIASSLRAVHPELEDASRIFGATRLRALFDITTPLIRNGVIATWIFIFIGSIRELSATILLFTARTKTISVTMFDLRESNDWGPIAVLSITMPSPVDFTTSPELRPTADRKIRSCRASARCILPGCSSQSRELPSMSVNRKVRISPCSHEFTAMLPTLKGLRPMVRSHPS